MVKKMTPSKTEAPKRAHKLGSEKLYRNAGVSEVIIEDIIMSPGDEFRASLDPHFEGQMLAGGHLEILEDQSQEADEAQAAEAEGREPVPGHTPQVDETEQKKSRRNR